MKRIFVSFILLFTVQVMIAQDVYPCAAEMPEFKEGKLAVFLLRHMEYPDDALKNHIVGRVWVNFIIDTLGNVAEPKVIRGIIPALDEEAIRLIRKTSGFWKPGKQAGRTVKVYYTQPFWFLFLPGHCNDILEIREFVRDIYSRKVSLPGQPGRFDIHYPEKALKAGIEGEVYVSLIIDTLGNVVQPKVVRPVHPWLDEEALRVIRESSGKWTPARYQGKKVVMPWGVPLRFKIPVKPSDEILIDMNHQVDN